jgi:TonB-dependent starch-binding outer membrane protein SusC
LKDADATAIYGSRAANGVVLITTKKGKAGDLKIDINAYSGIGHITRKLKLLDTKEYLAMRHEALSNDGIVSPAATDYDINGTWDSTRYTDWQKKLIGNTAKYNDVQLAISGVNTNTQYLIGTGYHKETTVQLGNGADQKAGMHFNIISTTSDQRFKISLTGSFVHDYNDAPSADNVNVAISLAPDAPPAYNPDGTLNWAPLTPGARGTWSNPYKDLQLTYFGRTTNLVGNTVISYKLFQGMEIKSSFGYTDTKTRENSTIPTTYYDPGANVTSGLSNFNSTSVNTWIVEPQVNYQVNWWKGKFAVLVGSTFQQNKSDALWQQASDYSSNSLLHSIAAAGSVNPIRYINNAYKYNAVFGRINYNLSEKYLLNITARRDASSRFGPEKQFANFYAVGAGWIFSAENFLKRSSLLSFGKIRGSYGTSGSDQIADYRYLDIYTSTDFTYQSQKGLYATYLYNPLLAWELSKKLEVGIELGLIQDKIFLSASYYRNRSGNQLIDYPLSAVTGFNSITQNQSAEVQNTGYELVINGKIFNGKSFTWSSGINISATKNKLISYPGLENSSFKNLYEVGKPLTIIKVYRSAGINSDNGLYQFINKEGNITTTPNSLTDRIININTSPKFYGGWQNSFTYGAFRLDILLDFRKQIGIEDRGKIGILPGFRGLNQPVSVLNRWRKPGDASTIQRFAQSVNEAYIGYFNVKESDLVYGDASFIRVKNLSLSYNTSISLLKRIKVKNSRFYVQAQNLLTITNYQGLDPETQGVTLPPLAVWTFGVQFNL